ncbi:hypothetical protein CLAIMM_10375 isoform 2 [Cladophialophora immunda]|nr:hypothetical protein CLAIMM_10375 isoform 2 [Cladophialophora immunda]
MEEAASVPRVDVEFNTGRRRHDLGRNSRGSSGHRMAHLHHALGHFSQLRYPATGLWRHIRCALHRCIWTVGCFQTGTWLCVADSPCSLPVWLYPQIVTLFVVLGCVYAQSWSVFTALRALQGLFGTVPQVIGLPIIHDMYAPHEWPRYINIWGTTFLVGPFLFPALAGYILQGTGSWRDCFKVLTGFYGFSTLMILAFGYETYYNRSTGVQQTNRVKSFLGIGNTNLPKAKTLSESTINIIKLTFTLPILLVGLSTMINFTWPIGITTTVDAFVRAPPYLFGNVSDAPSVLLVSSARFWASALDTSSMNGSTTDLVESERPTGAVNTDCTVYGSRSAAWCVAC